MDMMLKYFKRLVVEEDGLGTVEIVVIVAVLVGLALIFRKAIFSFANQILDRVFDTGGDVTKVPAASSDVTERTLK